MSLKKLSDFFDRVAKMVCVIMFVIMVIAAITQVFARYVINYPISWTEEAARYSFIWLNILGASIAVKHGTHAVITVIVDHIPTRLKTIIVLCVDVLVMFGGYLMLTQGVMLVTMTMNQLTPAIHIPMGYIYLSVPVSGLLIIFHKLLDFYTHIPRTSID
ncbi:TRAP transporter small permease [Acetomicrobium sp. UBA5826]|uniref:TRAP transporter small permease n=1 Tax=Acetomicrobium sp. UBA5826 TaxID=1946039 RepID=UPI00257D0F54|nr:TRAP transporter small permease [Acetomicrobium sp. UBA5826]